MVVSSIKLKSTLAKNDIIVVNRRRFQLSRMLGQGGTGSVWMATNLESKRGAKYALKVTYLDVSEMISSSACREIDCLSKLNHPNVLKLLDADDKQTICGRPASVMILECAHRGDLFELIKANNGLRIRRDEQEHLNSDLVHHVFREMVSAIEHMHEKGVCHRDIKPENILFDYHYNALVADMGFGGIFIENGLRKCMKSQLGSKGYHAPEIIYSSSYTENVDIFSLGVVLFNMYAGAPPFRQSRKSDWWFHKLATKKYDLFWKAHERTVTFSPALKVLMQGMLRVNPEERFTIKDIKESVWYRKRTGLTEHKYRHFMHELYKKSKPHYKYPGTTGVANKAKPISEHIDCISRKSKMSSNADCCDQLISLPTISRKKTIKRKIAVMCERDSDIEQKDAPTSTIRDSQAENVGELDVSTPSEKTPVLNADDIHQFHGASDIVNDDTNDRYTRKHIVKCLGLATNPIQQRV